MSDGKIFDYLNYRTYLQDWFDRKRREDQNYCYSTFAKAGSCSRTALANVLNGSRSPRAATLDAFARAMDLEPRERTYLGMLVELDTAPNRTSRRAVMDRILAVEAYGQTRDLQQEPNDDFFRFVEHWYIPVIKELAQLPGFRDDPEWVASKIRPPISTQEADDALRTLFELGYLRRNEEGDAEVTAVRARTEEQAQQQAINHYHRRVLPELLRQSEEADGRAQHLLASVLVLDADILPEAKAMLTVVWEKLATLADEHEPGEDARVYQFALQLLPVSAPLS